MDLTVVHPVKIASPFTDTHQLHQDLLNSQPVTNGSPPTANQSVTETRPPAALKEEPQKDQEETDTRVNGLISPNKPPSKLEYSQEMEPQTLCQTHTQLLHSEHKKSL